MSSTVKENPPSTTPVTEEDYRENGVPNQKTRNAIGESETKEEKKFWDQHGTYLFPTSYNKKHLPPNVYSLSRNSNGKVVLSPHYEENKLFTNNSYFPLENYNKHLNKADDIIDRFLESKDLYEEKDIHYKRSVFFYGETGSGKSQYINAWAKRLINDRRAVVFQLSDGNDVRLFSDICYKINSYLHERLKVVIIEELPKLIEEKNTRDAATLFLDHPEFREDVLFLSTGNNPELLPENFVKRSGRLDFLIPVYGEDNDLEHIKYWYKHLMDEEFPASLDEPWVQEMAKMPPATTENIFTFHKVNLVPLKEAYDRMKKRNQLIENEFRRGSEVGF